MTGFLENFIEKLIGEGLITESELEQRINEEREKSIVVPFQELSSFLMYDAMTKDYLIENLEVQNAELTYLLLTGGF